MKIRHSEPHGPLRAKAYPDVGDQLDTVMKLADALRAQGIWLPQEVHEWIDQCKAVKNKYKKRT